MIIRKYLYFFAKSLLLSWIEKRLPLRDLWLQRFLTS
jgi:hypothetical protein